LQHHGPNDKLRKIEIKVNDKGYFDFLSVYIEEELSAEEKLKNIIRFHIITYRNRRKIKNQTLFLISDQARRRARNDQGLQI